MVTLSRECRGIVGDKLARRIEGTGRGIEQARKITVYGKRVFGNIVYSIVEEHQRAAVQALTGKTTINRKQIRALEYLGIEVELTGDPAYNL